MSKKSVLVALLVFASLVLVLGAVAGCTKPKPEPKLTPTASPVASVKPGVTGTPASGAPTQPAVEPTVVTTKPTPGVSPAASPAATVATTGGSASPTAVVIPATPGATVAPTQPAASGVTIEYTVAAGDTLYSIAARYGTTVDAIVALNKLAKPDAIYAGMKLKIPQGAGGQPVSGGIEYIVQVGDNMSSIAVKFDVTVDAILKANGLSNPDFVYAGQKLVIPKGGATAPASSGGRVHVVKAGETLGTIAAKYGVTQKAIIDLNHLANPNLIYPGQTLRIP